MRRLRVRKAPAGTLELLLNLTNRHVHAQLVDRGMGSVVLGVHTTEPGIRHAITQAEKSHIQSYATGTVKAAATIGDIFAERAVQRGIHTVFWKAPGKYHGKIKAFIDAVRSKGIKTMTPPPPGTPPVPEITN